MLSYQLKILILRLIGGIIALQKCPVHNYLCTSTGRSRTKTLL